MNLTLEVFITQLLSDRVRYCRCEMRLDSNSPPDSAVQNLIKDRRQKSPLHCENYLSHSTSWRYEAPGNVVLTYVVCLAESECDSDGWKELHLDDFHLACSDDVRRPQPTHITETHVLSHAIRHLAFLSQQTKNQAIGQAIFVRASLLSRVKPALAGQLH